MATTLPITPASIRPTEIPKASPNSSPRPAAAASGPQLPELNWAGEPRELQEIVDLLRFWANRGVDGFRLDAARYYVEGPHGESDTQETHRMIQKFTRQLRREFTDVFFVGEIFADVPTIAPGVNNAQNVRDITEVSKLTIFSTLNPIFTKNIAKPAGTTSALPFTVGGGTHKNEIHWKNIGWTTATE